MTLFANALALVILFLICIIHFLSIVLPALYSKIITFVNIGLHIAFFAVAFFGGTEIGDITLGMMISVFSYLLFALIFNYLRRRRDDV